MIYLTVFAIPVISAVIGMVYANVRGADFRPEYTNIR